MRAASLFLLALSEAAFAADPTGKYFFRIESGGAEETLNEFSTQSGLQTLFNFDSMRPLRTRAVSGAFDDPFVALDQMIAGTPIRYEFINQRTVTLSVPQSRRSEDSGGYIYTQGGWHYSCVPLMPFGTLGYSASQYRELEIAIGLGEVPRNQLYCVPDIPVDVKEPREYLPPPNEVAVTVNAKRKSLASRAPSWGPRR